MAKTRNSSRSTARYALVIAVALPSCARTEPARFATVDQLVDAPRKPDGVAIDPEPAPPASQPAASTRDGLVALSSPLSTELAIEALASLLTAITAESQGDLSRLASPQALWSNPWSSNRAALAFSQVFRERFRKLDYTQLAGRQLFVERDVEVYGFDDLATPQPGRPARPAEMAQGDVLLRARMLVPRMGPDRLFGDELLVMMRPQGGRFRVQLLLEDFQLP